MRIPLGKTVNRQLLQDLGFNLNTIYSVDENFFIKLPRHLTCNERGNSLTQYDIKFGNLLVMSGFEKPSFWDYQADMGFMNENVAIVKEALTAKKESSTKPDNPHPASLFFLSSETQLKIFNASEVHPASLPGPAQRQSKTYVPRLTAQPVASGSTKTEVKTPSTKISIEKSDFQRTTQKSNYSSSLAKNINNLWQTQNKTAVLVGTAAFLTATTVLYLNNKMR